MAGGIDWFRWHHGTVTDQKFPLIAKRAGASVAEAIAVWACLLEAASMNEKERGLLDAEPDFEAMDCALGLPDGRSQSIFRAMRDRSLLDAHLHITAWPRRQPKRERDDDSSTGRVQAFRERQRQETPGNANETPTEASQRTETPRGEESREETTAAIASVVASAKPPRATRKCPDSFEPTEPDAWIAENCLGVDWRAETAKFRDHTFRTAISDWPGAWRNWMRRSVKPSAGVAAPTFRERDQQALQERVFEMTGGLMGSKPDQRRMGDIIDMEQPNGTVRAIR